MPGPRPPCSPRALRSAAILALLAGRAALAQCDGQWTPVGGPGGSGSQTGVLASILWDPDGPGPEKPWLVVAGQFATFNGVMVNNIVAWDGVGWLALGPGLGQASSWVGALAVLPSGALVAGGTFTNAGGTSANRIAVWNGASWSPLGPGMNNEVTALAVDEATGDLYAGGLFTSAGGNTANRVARWNGSTWSSLGSGSGNGVGNVVYALAPMPGGGVYVGGAFTSAGGVSNRRYVGRWTGSAWGSLGSGCNALVLALHVLSTGDLVAGGTFTTAGGQGASRVARWTGSAWSAMGSGFNAQPLCLAETTDGQLLAGGHFVSSGSTTLNRFARWDGSAWQPLGAGMDQYVMTLTTAPSGQFWAGGGFSSVDALASPFLARHDPRGPVMIDHGPESATTCQNGSPTLSVTASGPGPVAIGWEIEREPGEWASLSTEPLELPGGGWASAAYPSADATPISIVHSPGVFEYGVRAVASDVCDSSTSAVAIITICPSDLDNGSGSGTCDGGVDINDLLYFLAMYESGALGADLDDGSGLGVPDGGVDVNDLLFFLAHFLGGC